MALAPFYWWEAETANQRMKTKETNSKVGHLTRVFHVTPGSIQAGNSRAKVRNKLSDHSGFAGQVEQWRWTWWHNLKHRLSCQETLNVPSCTSTCCPSYQLPKVQHLLDAVSSQTVWQPWEWWKSQEMFSSSSGTGVLISLQSQLLQAWDHL